MGCVSLADRVRTFSVSYSGIERATSLTESRGTDVEDATTLSTRSEAAGWMGGVSDARHNYCSALSHARTRQLCHPEWGRVIRPQQQQQPPSCFHSSTVIIILAGDTSASRPVPDVPLGQAHIPARVQAFRASRLDIRMSRRGLQQGLGNSCVMGRSECGVLLGRS